MSVQLPTLHTPRLVLRPHRIEEFDAYAAMWAEPGVTRFIGGVPFSREAAWTRLLRQIGSWHALGFGFLAIEDRETGAFIGEAGFHDLKRGFTPSIEGTMEAGWALIGAAQAKGLAEEAMRAMLGWAQQHGRGERITCIIHPDHGASIRVAGKLGFGEFARTTYNNQPIVLMERPRRLADGT